jgi:hypothetical protein
LEWWRGKGGQPGKRSSRVERRRDKLVKRWRMACRAGRKGVWIIEILSLYM